MLILVSACRAPSITPVPPIAAPTAAPIDISIAPAPFLLRWQGYTEMGSDNDPTRCKQFQVTNNSENVQLGYCDQPQKSIQSPAALQQIQQFAQHIATFEFKDSQDNLTFGGTGTETNPVWQRAILQWVHLRYAELESEHACASCATVFSWFLDKPAADSELCRHVYVTSFGDAIAEKTQCHPQGDTPQAMQESLLGTTEMITLDEWLYSRAQIEDGDNYFLGQGTQPITPADQPAMQTWAEQVYNRLLPN